MTIASLCMGFWQTLQMYEQFSQTGLPSDRRSRFVLCSTRLLHLAHRLREPKGVSEASSGREAAR